MSAHVILRMARRKLRRLLHQLLFPKAAVRHYGVNPMGPQIA